MIWDDKKKYLYENSILMKSSNLVRAWYKSQHLHHP